MTEKQAVQLAKSGWWKSQDAQTIVRFQLFESRLCMDFADFHLAVEKCLGRGVWTHEFADQNALQQEYLGHRPVPSITEIINMVPELKIVMLIT